MAIHQIRFAASALVLIAGISNAGVLSSPAAPSDVLLDDLRDSAVTFTPISETAPAAPEPPRLPGVIAHSDIPDLPGRRPAFKKDGAWEWTHDDSVRPRTLNPMIDLNARLYDSGENDSRGAPTPPPPIDEVRGSRGNIPPIMGGSVISGQLPGYSNSAPTTLSVPISQIPAPSSVVLLGLGGLTSLRRRR